MRQHVRLEIVTKYYPEAEDAGMGKVQTWTKPTSDATEMRRIALASKTRQQFLETLMPSAATSHARHQRLL